MPGLPAPCPDSSAFGPWILAAPVISYGLENTVSHLEGKDYVLFISGLLSTFTGARSTRG